MNNNLLLSNLHLHTSAISEYCIMYHPQDSTNNKEWYPDIVEGVVRYPPPRGRVLLERPVKVKDTHTENNKHTLSESEPCFISSNIKSLFLLTHWPFIRPAMSQGQYTRCSVTNLPLPLTRSVIVRVFPLLFVFSSFDLICFLPCTFCSISLSLLLVISSCNCRSKSFLVSQGDWLIWDWFNKRTIAAHLFCSVCVVLAGACLCPLLFAIGIYGLFVSFQQVRIWVQGSAVSVLPL